MGEAEKLGLEVLEAGKRNLGLEHPDTISAMGGLAITYFKQDRLSEAEGLELEVLELRKKNFGRHAMGYLCVPSPLVKRAKSR